MSKTVLEFGDFECQFKEGDTYSDQDGTFIIESVEPIKDGDTEYIIGYKYILTRAATR